MANVLSLESFETALTADDGPSSEYSLGYEDGLNAGLAAARTEIDALNEQFTQSITEIDFTYAEARGRVLQSLAPLFRALTEQVLPHCVENGFAGQLAEKLFSLANNEAGKPLTLFVHPDFEIAASNLITALPAQAIVQADPELGRHAAWIGPIGNEIKLDVDSLLAEITSNLTAINNIEQEAETNG